MARLHLFVPAKFEYGILARVQTWKQPAKTNLILQKEDSKKADNSTQTRQTRK
jgi:hypothetical protein